MTEQYDPVAELVETARRKDAEAKAKESLTIAKVRILTGRAVDFDMRDKNAKNRACGVSGFFGSLIRRTKYIAEWGIPTACTNGKRTFYNPGFVTAQSIEQLIGLLCHEAMHDGFGHHARLLNLDHQRANVAADLAINDLLFDCGIKLPDGGLRSSIPFPYRGQQVGPFPPRLSFEEYYSLLPDTPSGSGGDGSLDGPEGWGEVEAQEGANQATQAKALQEARQNLAGAAQEARQMGTVPESMEKMVDELLAPKINWRSVIQEFLNASAQIDTSWDKPARKWLAQGHYMPSLSGQSIGHVVIFNDESGSLDSQEMRNRKRSEAVGMAMAANPARVDIFHHDSEIHRHETWEAGDGDLPWHPVGGGGTSHMFMHDAINGLDSYPDLVICLTDLMSVFPEHPPACPVLWATTYDAPQPWGSRVLMVD